MKWSKTQREIIPESMRSLFALEPVLTNNSIWGYFPRLRGTHQRAQGRQIGLRLGVVLLIMLDTLRHIFNGTRPVDLIMLAIEALVLLLIAGEQIVHAVHAARIGHRGKRVAKAFAQGQALYNSVPNQGDIQTASERARQWMPKVDAWIEETAKLLKEISPEAAAAFIHDSGHAYPISPRINSYAATKFAVLLERLNSLRKILEMRDVYF